jgi:hypothetical protein
MSEVIKLHPETYPAITLSSGQVFAVHKVKLFWSDAVNQIAGLKAQAQQNLGGVHTGIGFWGSPGWVIEGALVLGAIESMLSSAAAKKGMRQLAEARNLYIKLMSSHGQFFDVRDVTNFGLPQPGLWYVDNRREVTEEGFFGNTKTKTISTLYVHNGDEFVTLETDAGVINVRWSEVTVTGA